MGGKEGQETGRKENGREGGNERKERGLGKRCQKGKKKKKSKTGRQGRGHSEGTQFPSTKTAPSGGAWPVRDVSAPFRRRRRRHRPRPRVVKSQGSLVAAGLVGPRSLGGCESLDLWPPAQPAPAAGQGGNCPETRRLSGRVVQGRASGTRGGGSHAPLRAPRAVRLRPPGDLPPPGEPEKRRGRPPLLADILRAWSPPPVKTGSKGTCRQPEDPGQSPGST